MKALSSILFIVFVCLSHSALYAQSMIELGDAQTKLTVKLEKSELSLQIHSESAFTTNVFAFENPARIVVDAKGIKLKSHKLETPKKDSLLKGIRMGFYPDKIRLVLDLNAKTLPQYNTAQEGNDFTLTIGGKDELGELGAANQEENTPTPKPTSTPTNVIEEQTPVEPTPALIVQETPTPTNTPQEATNTPLPTLTHGKVRPTATPTRTATVTKTPRPTHTHKPTRTPTPTKTPKHTATIKALPTATIEATLTPTIAPTEVAPQPTAEVLVETPSPSPAPTSAATLAATSPAPSPTETPAPSPTPLAKQLSNISFRLPSGEASMLRLILTQESPFKLMKEGHAYTLIVPDCQLAGPHLSLPQYPPENFIGISAVQAKLKDKDLVISIYVDRGIHLSASRNGTEIWIKASQRSPI